MVVKDIAATIEERLKELSPEFRLREKGYRLPLPRVRQLSFASALGGSTKSRPIEIRDALQRSKVVFVHIPRGYPDSSLPWVLAADLLTAVVDNSQIMPIVVDGLALRPPKTGLEILGSKETVRMITGTSGIQPIFILDEIPLSSKTRLNFLVEEVANYPSAGFIFLTRSDPNLIRESEFSGRVGATIFEVSPVSFSAITHFVQKNFDMNNAEAEVIALRLRETFEQFDLPAHPTYFAGLLKETLSALLQANRRAELIQLAVDGFLTFVVADDTADVNLSRTTRSRFLRHLVVKIRVENIALDHQGVIALVVDFAKQYDFDIQPIAFINSFVERGIIHFTTGRVQFSLPFIECYLLAVELSQHSNMAMRYFNLNSLDFDIPTFDIYAEIGASADIVKALVESLEDSCKKLGIPNDATHVLLSDNIRPAMLDKPEQLHSLQMRLLKAVEEVNESKGDIKKKQQMLDIFEHMQEKAARQSKERETSSSAGGDMTSPNKLLDEAVFYWVVGSVLLGSGSEQLEAKTKRNLAGILIRLSSLIIHHWTHIHKGINFTNMSSELLRPDSVSRFSELVGKESDTNETRKLIIGLIEVLEFSLLAGPFRKIMHYLCEQARHGVLATSVEHATTSDAMEAIIHAVWLADIDSQRGAKMLKSAIRECPQAEFLRINLATHFLIRVYWSHWKKEDRLMLLEAADEAIRPMKVKLDKGRLRRAIENDEGKSMDDTRSD